MNELIGVLAGIFINCAVSAYRILLYRYEKDNEDVNMDFFMSKTALILAVLGFGLFAGIIIKSYSSVVMLITGSFALFCLPALIVEKQFFDLEPTPDDFHRHIATSVLGVFILVLEAMR